jgi:hypothetical protein
MNAAVMFIVLVFLILGIGYVFYSAHRVMRAKRFLKEVQTAYREKKISYNDYAYISRLFIFADGFSYSYEQYMRNELRQAYAKKQKSSKK